MFKVSKMNYYFFDLFKDSKISFFFVNHRKKKTSTQSTKERNAKQNLLDIKFDKSIRGGMCLALKVQFTTYYDLPFTTY